MKLLKKNNYSKHRESLKSGDLLAWRGKTFVGRFVRTWTGSDFSHVGIVWRISDRVFILEASEFAGVRIRPLSNALPCYWIQSHVNWRDDIETHALSHIGDRYSYMDALRAGLGMKTNKNNGWQCAEFASYLLKSTGMTELNITATPQALVERVIELNS